MNNAAIYYILLIFMNAKILISFQYLSTTMKLTGRFVKYFHTSSLFCAM